MRRFFKESEYIIVRAVLWLIVLLSVMFGITKGIKLGWMIPLIFSSLLIVATSYCFKEKSKYYISMVALVSIVSSILCIQYFIKGVLDTGTYIEVVSFAVGVSNIILLLFVLLKQSWIGLGIKGVILILLFLPILFLWGYYLTSGALVGADAVLAILQTNMDESKEYISEFMSMKNWLILFCLMLVFGCVGFLVFKLEQQFFLKYGSTFIIVLILSNSWFIYNHRKNLIINTVNSVVVNVQNFIKEYESFEKRKFERKEALGSILKSIDTKQRGIYVLVIGESQNRNHMSAYGYKRETTPWLTSMKRENNFILFNKAYSCHTHTVPVLTYALTAKNQYNKLNLTESVSLLEVAEAAGFETVWISNQVKYGAWDTPISVISDEANQQFWHNKNIGKTTKTNFYDLSLLDSIEKMQITDKMLVIVHLMGNHSSYSARYPKEFKRYTGKNRLDEYDNSILYNDYVMKNLYDRFMNLPDFKSLIYFADHADAVKQGLYHNSSKFVPEMTHIPMYMYFSDAYVNEFTDKVVSLNKAKSNVFTNDLIFNTVLSILDIQVEKVYEANNDITSSGYDSDNKRFKTLYGKKQIIREGM